MASPRERKGPRGWRAVLRRLRSRYRLVLIDDRTFEERFSLRLNRLGVLVLTVLTFALYGGLIVAVIVLTPLKRYIPGYSDQETRLNAYRSTVQADSLALALEYQRLYLDNLRAVLTGELPADSASLRRPVQVKPSPEELRPGAQDSMLRARWEKEERYSLAEGRGTTERRELASILFVPPVQGIITAGLDPQQRHFGVDVVTKSDEAVKCCLAGTVVLASWTTDAGHVIQVQHTNGLTSVYKHNRVLLKKAGDRVRAGEAIAIVGDTGENTSGPHLHFELWHNGIAVDPSAYMVFQ
ncbi:MAG: M23 family metallopeptidase [Flavobacteriales bacterium]|nr:M23 family metallopeptidase [Flavobacteriales bacterium]